MGTFADFLQEDTTSTPDRASKIPESLLDNLRRTESGKDDLALNKESKAMGAYQFLPETVQMMHKQGIKFNPFDEKESREAARIYLEKLLERNKGDLSKAVAQYGGFVKQDPTSYVNKVMKGVDVTQPEPAISDFSKFLAEEAPAEAKVSKEVPTITPKAAPVIVQPPKVNPITAVKNEILSKQAQENPATIASDVLMTLLSGIQAPIVGGITGKIAELRSPQFGTPQGAQIAEEQLRNYMSQTVHQPTTPTGQKIIDFLGQIPEKLTGSHMGFGILPEAQVAAPAAAVSLSNLAAPAAPVVNRAVQAAGKLENPFRQGTPEQLAALAKVVPKVEAAPVVAGSAGAAAAEINPFKGKITGEESARGQFPQVKLSKISKDVPESEQNLRAEIAHEINPTGQVREGVITGNENILRNEHQEQKNPNPTPRGELLKQQIADEQNALSNYAQKRIEATGASPTLINEEQRGMRINDVFHGQPAEGEAPNSLVGYLENAKKQVYDSAYKLAGDKQIKTNHIDKLLENPQWKAGLGLKGNEGVAKSAAEMIKLAKEVGFEDVAGKMHPAGSVGAYDAVRKAMNAEYTQTNASTIRKINQAIDKDIAAVADPKLYKLGDKIHQVEKTIFDSKGIKNLFGEADANGVISSSTPLEKITTKLNNLPKDQWRHVRDTLDELAKGRVRGAPEGMPPIPKELQEVAAAARAEIDGALARAVYEAGATKAGVWNQNSVNNVLNSTIGEKIAETFNPDEVRKFHVLNYGGQIMPGIHSYEGGAAQAERIASLRSKYPAAGEAIGATAGAAISPFVAPVTAAVGRKIGEKALAKSTEKELSKQREILLEQMRKNAQRPKIMNLGE